MTVSPYLGLPPLGGLCSMENAMKEGILVDECVRRLKRFHYAFKRLHEIFASRITAEPIYELKMAYSHHAYLCSEHASALRGRVAEMREPPLGLDQVPDPGLEVFFDEIQAAPAAALVVSGLYGRAIPALQQALEAYLTDTNPLADAPSVRLCRFALLELADMAEFGSRAIACLQTNTPESDAEAWLGYLGELLRWAAGLDGTGPEESAPSSRRFSAQPYSYDPVPRRDERFRDPYNMGVNAEAFLYDPSYPANAKALMLYYKRLREIDVPEMMASILTQTEGRPWEYYRDLTRQLWDEARHAMMGEVGFNSLELDWPALTRINFTWSLALNTQLEPWERHAVLFAIEQGLMKRTGKRYEWEVAGQSGEPLSMLFQDFDWADEVLHARIGQAWYVSAMPSRTEALDFAEACWSKVFLQWRAWYEQGLIGRENWWPALYLAACEKWGIAPDPEALAFEQSYGMERAELKEASG